MKKIRKLSLSAWGIALLLFTISCGPEFTGEEKAEWEITDSLVSSAIKEELRLHPEVPSDEIEVVTNDGIVILYGTVDDLLSREEAKQIASTVKGVKGIVNNLEVKADSVPDRQLKDEIERAIELDPVLDPYELRVEVNNGVVHVTGAADSWHEKKMAGDVVKSVRGVMEVKNDVAFVHKKDRPDEEIEKDIKSLFRNDVRIDDGLIDVKVEDGKVTLSGEVGSYAERSLAIVNAQISGVDTVLSEDLAVERWARDPMMRSDKYVEKPDPVIINAIQQAFLNDPRLLNYDIKVTSQEGEVTLSGVVPNAMAKKAAAQDAGNIVGVWEVNNNIEVKPVRMPAPNTVIDNVRVSLEVHPRLSKYDFTVDSSNDTLYLSGRVQSVYEREEAEDIALKIPGVVDLVNNIEVTRKQGYAKIPGEPDEPETVIKHAEMKPDEAIKRDIEKQLWWSPFVNEDEVEVSVENGEVTLTGTVDTELERRYAQENAYDGGAFSVTNNLKVDYWKGEDLQQE